MAFGAAVLVQRMKLCRAVDAEQDVLMFVRLLVRGSVGHRCVVCPCVRVSVCVVWQTDGWTPLCIASDHGQVEVMRALVEAGAAVNQADVREDWGVDVGVRVCVGSWCLDRNMCVQLCGVSMALETCGAHAALRVVPRPLMLSRTC
jgi:hypothetical protein